MTERERKEFQRIMELGSMPPHTGPDYDEWLFTKSWQAALASREVEMGEMRKRINKLPRWPYNTWDEQSLIKVGDVLRLLSVHAPKPHVSVAYNHLTGEKVVTPDPCHDPEIKKEFAAAGAHLILAKARYFRAAQAIGITHAPAKEKQP